MAQHQAEYIEAKQEPPLSEVLSDPIVKLLMDFDGVDRDELAPLLDEARERMDA